MRPRPGTRTRASFRYLTPAADDTHAGYLALVNCAIEGPEAFSAKRERIDEFGWRHFGDIYADHEAVAAGGPRRFVSHYNNQYDAVHGFAVQFLRSGDARWWNAMDELARHVVDIDIYHTTRTRRPTTAALFWHTYHYVDAGTVHPPHVSEGARRLRRRAVQRTRLLDRPDASPLPDRLSPLAGGCHRPGRWVIDMDDGRKTVFRWLAGGDTGLASSTGSELYHGPGRGAANSILTLLERAPAHGRAAVPRQSRAD